MQKPRKLNANNCGSGEHQCLKCNRTFMSAQGLTTHQRIHSEKNEKLHDEKYVRERINNTKSVQIHRQLNPKKPVEELIKENKMLIDEATKFENFLQNEINVPIVWGIKDKIAEHQKQEQEQEQELWHILKKQKNSGTLNVNNLYNENQNPNLMMLSEAALLLQGGEEGIGNKNPIALIENPEEERTIGNDESIKFRKVTQSNDNSNGKDYINL